MMMGQVNVEAGMPATGYAGGSVWTQQPTESNADFSSDDLVSQERRYSTDASPFLASLK